MWIAFTKQKQGRTFNFYMEGVIDYANQTISQRCVLPVSFPVDLLIYGSNKSTGKETGKTHLCACAGPQKPEKLTLSKIKHKKFRPTCLAY